MERLIGEAAKNQAALNTDNTFFDAKRLIGRNFKDKTVLSDRKLLPFQIVDKGGKPYMKVPLLGKDLAPEEISSMILTKMKDIAEAFLSQKVKHAVITVPA